MVFGIIYACCGLMASDTLPIDCYEGRLMMPEEDSQLFEFVDEISARLQVASPNIYVLALDHPNVLAWATASGRTGFARIGISPDLRNVLGPAEVQAAMAMAMVRIASGESALLARGASLAGLAIQAAYSPFANSTLGFMKRDPVTGLTPVGGLLLAILSPMARGVLAVTDPGTSWSVADAGAMRLLGAGVPVASMLRKLYAATGQTRSGGLRAYNPGLVGLFLVSPLEKLVVRADAEYSERKAEAKAYAAAKAEAAAAAKEAARAAAQAAASGPSGPHGPIGAAKPPAKASPERVARPPEKERLSWQAAAAAWIAGEAPSTDSRVFTVDPNGVIEPGTERQPPTQL
jgi:Zn-dependent protease with chaperone function